MERIACFFSSKCNRQKAGSRLDVCPVISETFGCHCSWPVRVLFHKLRHRTKTIDYWVRTQPSYFRGENGGLLY